MTESFILCILCIFAVFGIISFIYISIFQTIKKTPVVIGVHNRENSIECELRQLMLRNPCSEIIVVDMSSNDSTRTIVQKMSDDYPQIRLINTDCKNDVMRIIN